jgi:hypothetical protein
MGRRKERGARRKVGSDLEKRRGEVMKRIRFGRILGGCLFTCVIK